MLARRPAGPVDPGWPALVLVHGLGLSGRSLVPLGERLAERYPVWIPDLPGFGDSERPDRTLDIPELADALAGWMDAVGLERAAVAGHSLGGQVAIDLAARRPERVDRLILFGPTMDPAAPTLLGQAIRLLRATPLEPLGSSLTVLGDILRCAPTRILATARMALADPVLAKLPRVAAPTLVVGGGRDPITPPGWLGRVAGALPDARLVLIPGAGHLVQTSRPAETARAVAGFLGEPARGPSAVGSRPPQA